MRDAARLMNRPLLDSRERWQDMVRMAADLAFEIDSKGQFSLVVPDDALGWPSGTLVGQPSGDVLLENARGISPNPFRPHKPSKGGRTWVKRYDGSAACLLFYSAPLFDAKGEICGARGIAIDVTEYHDEALSVASSLRRGEVMDFILWSVAQEVIAPRMMDTALATLVNALAADGAAVVVARAGGLVELLHCNGTGSDEVWHAAIEMIEKKGSDSGQCTTVDGRAVLAVGCRTRFDAHAALVVWRMADPRPWDRDDTALAYSAGGIIRVILEHEAIQHEMGRQARTDGLTGLLNRRAFMEEMQRHADRLDMERELCTLMFVDLDHFKQVNDRFGHDTGDQVLMEVARILRDLVRPSDLVGRFGGDEFAIWMSGADYMTAAERADYLRQNGPRQLNELLPEPVVGLGFSIGIATRAIGSKEPIEDLMRRADEAMYEVKRGGRGHWRVSHPGGPDGGK
jgi:diguanylate cyclase (GGDEF)-like protein